MFRDRKPAFDFALRRIESASQKGRGDRDDPSSQELERKRYWAVPTAIRVMTYDRGRFAYERGSNLLLYWPHGVGDWVQFSVVAPYLNATNRYWITRWGDDIVSVLDGHTGLKPIYLGTNPCSDGSLHGHKHFGIDFDSVDGRELIVNLPASLHEVIRDQNITGILCGDYPEPKGRSAFPFHSKARNMLNLLGGTIPANFDSPLPSTMSLQVPLSVSRLVNARLKNECGLGDRKMCVIARQGQSSHMKNWGHAWREDLPAFQNIEGQECLDFMKQMLRADKRWFFLLMEERPFVDSLSKLQPQCYAYCNIFGQPENGCIPFGLVLKCLMQWASLCVGVPTGPYHFAAQVDTLPTVGIWLEHLPSWYDEPRDGLTHVIGSQAAAQIGQLPGSFLKHGAFAYSAMSVDTRTISGEAVMAAAQKVLRGR